MERISFEEWWAEFQIDTKGDKSGGYDSLRRLRQYVGGLNAESRRAFLSELKKLVARHGPDWGVAQELLKESELW